MEPSKDIISVRLARLNNQFLGRSVGVKTNNALKRSLHRDGLLDALSVLYEECNNESLKKGDAQISKFVEKYRPILTELRQLRVNIADFEVKDIIGRGHFGEVHIVREKQTRDVYAMKTIKKEATLKLKNVAFYEEERDIMALSKSPWLVSLQYAFQDSSQLYLVMEFCPGGDLNGLLERKGVLPEPDAVYYVAEIIMALHHLHSLGYVHRDVKPENLLIDRCGHLKLSDFGSAAKIPPGGSVNGPMPVGTPYYIAPELLKSLEDPNKHPHGTPCDYWSLGIVMFELVCGQPPFVGRRVGAVYAAILNHKGGLNSNTHNSIQWPAASKDNLAVQPTAAYKDAVCRLLNPVPERRLKHEQLLRHQLFSKICWNTLRDQTPPYVPLVKSEDDSSNFSKPEKQQHTPSVSSLRQRPHFTGRNLPFIGFTYAPDVLPGPAASGSGDAEGSTIDGERSSESDTPDGFLNSSLNSTAICLSSFREMEKLLESRKREIEILHKRVAASESQNVVGVERGKQVEELEKQRSKLEEQLTEMACYNQDTMAKARRLTRQSFFEPSTSSACVASNEEQIKKDHEEQIQALKSRHKEELDALLKEDKLECQRLQKMINETKDREQNLRVELEERMKDYTSLQIQCMEIPMLQQKVAELEDHSTFLLERGSKKLAQGKEKYQQLCIDKEELQKKVENLEFTVCSLETDVMEKDELILKLENEKGELTIRLNSANLKEEKYRQKVAELEELLMKLQNEVTRLERRKPNAQSPATKEIKVVDKENPKTPNSSVEKNAFLEERIQTLEKQLKEAHEEAVLLKQEARKANSALWKKEKELSDSDLDKRIATRELKQAEGKLKTLEEEKTKMLERHHGALKELKATLTERDAQVAKLSSEVSALTSNIEKCEEKLKECQSKVDNDTLAYEKLTQEFDRSKNDVHRLKAELQYSENRRLKAESVGETYRQEAREAAEERKSSREERQTLQDLLQTREKELRALNQSYKALQGASTMLEEQLIEFENITESQEETNQQLKEELDGLRSEVESLKAELCSCRSLMDDMKCDSGREEEKLTQTIRELRQQKDRNMDLEKQLDELLARESSLQNDLEARCDDHDRSVKKIEKLENEMLLMRGQCTALKEEASELRTELAHVREDALRAQHELAESQDRIESLRGLIEELEAQTVHWKQRELKAEATIHQHLKLIDFLQAKVEEAGRKKKTLSDMLFGSKSKENLPPSLNATPLRDNKINRELREQVSELKQKLESVQGSVVKSIDTVDTSATPRKPSNSSKNLFGGTFATPSRVLSTPSRVLSTPSQVSSVSSSIQRKDSEKLNKPLMEGWVRIEKDSLLHRVYMELNDERVRWRSEVGSQNVGNKGEIISVKGFSLHKDLTKDLLKGILLSSTEQSNGLMLISNTTRLLIVCPSPSQRKDWLTSFVEAGCEDPTSSGSSSKESTTSASLMPSYSSGATSLGESQIWGRQLINIEQNLLKYPRCVVEIDEDTLLIGSDGGMFSWIRNRNEVVKISSWDHGVHSVTIAPEIDACILLSSPAMPPVGLSLRQLKAVLKSLPSTKAQLQPSYIPLALQSKEQCNVTKMCPSRSLLFIGTSQQLHILSHVAKNQSFSPMHRINMQHGVSSLLVTPHTLLVAAQTVFEVDLKSFSMEDFLDPSDNTISHAVYGLKKNIYPVSIFRIKDGQKDGDIEYLICYKEFGIFVDSFGQRSRSDDVYWNSVPLKFVYRKPFLFTIHATCICIIEIREHSFKKNNCNGDDVSVSEASTSSLMDADKVVVNVKSPNHLGKSTAQGSIYVSVHDSNKQTQIIELCGSEAFKKNLGISTETLDTIDDNDSCKNVLAAGDTSESVKAETLSLDTDESIEIKSDFASHIRQKAKLFNTMKSERQKVQTIQGLLSGKKDNCVSSDESDTSSSCSERNVIVHHQQNSLNKHQPLTSSHSSDSSKKVRFNR